MARQINEEAVYEKINQMDLEDGTDYESDLADEEEGGEEEELEPDTTGGEDQTGEVEAGTEEGTQEAGQAGTEEAGQQQQLRRFGNNAVDGKGNIVDPRTRQIIAKAGTERRLYEKSERLTKMLDDHKVKLAQYEKDHNDSNQYFGAIKAAGLSVDEIGEAFNIAIMYKQNPVAAAKEVLERVLAMGHNVTDILGSDPGNAIEMPAIARMIEQRLAPIVKPLEQQRVSDEKTRQAQEAFGKWVSDNEYADIHLEALDNLMGQHPELSPQKAYNALVLFANKHQLDFTQPLGPQIDARQSARGSNTNPQTRRAQKPFPVGGSSTPQPLDEGGYADSSASWSDIIRSSMNGGARPQR
jgi:hypothetical protein